MHQAVRLTALSASLFASLAVAEAYAQPPAAQPPAAQPPAGTAPRATSARQEPDRRISEVNAVEQRITALRAKLQITTAQEPQWNQFAQVMRDNARRMDDTFQLRAQGIAAMNAEANMASYAQVAASHAQGMQNLVPAFHALYTTMPDLQKRAADQVFRDDAHHGGASRNRPGAGR